MSYTNPTLKRADSTTIGVKTDRLLDEISFYKDKVKRAIHMVEDMTAAYTDSAQTEVAFDFTEVMLVLVETKIDSELRRFPVADNAEHVLGSTSTETKEDTQ